MKPPSTYAEWCNLFDELKFAPANESYIECIQNGQIEFIPGVAQRFTARLTEVVNTRLGRISESFNKSIHRANADDRSLITALRNTQKEFSFLKSIIYVLSLPDEFKKIYINSIKEQAQRIQNSLETTARADRTGKLSSIIKNNSIHV